ncbi:hypothetical protein HN031_18665 [Nocardioides sp. zg-1308]|uniref:hypothetical protein n=1 Tax=Nocardioides sp. zg-1308 TaxID=2736253 RepID=UPI001558011E|nr:hypothetical protein [Nocardioides sp. zg-1308]NPD06700.1 hypothetical protein [Nocardioides sp. zg-1308]
MSTTDLPVRPDVAGFVDRVRDLLSDLPEEDRLELTEGLEADLADQVAEQGADVLGDAVAYARELRTAAGFDPVPGRRPSPPAGVMLLEQLDAARAWFDLQVSRPRVVSAWRVLVTLRPAWWVLRAWAASVVVALLWPGWYDYGLTWLPGVHPAIGLLMLAVCVVGSALVGLGVLWPGARTPGSRSLLARVVLLALNLCAIVSLPVINGELDQQSWSRYNQGYGEAELFMTESGVLNGGREVCNIAAYDAAGQPLTGVQLFDQEGRPLDVRCWDQQARTVPWILGDVARWNVFPLAERERPARTSARRADLGETAFPVPDRATTPEVTHPLVSPGPADEPQPDRAERREKAGEGRETPRNDRRP